MKKINMWLLFFWYIATDIFLTETIPESDINDLCDRHRCVCQVNLNPGNYGCQREEKLQQENSRMNETIWLLQQEIRRLKADRDRSSDKVNENPVILLDGARWRAFWWYKKSSGWPACLYDVLQDKYGKCNPDAPYCFGRLPEQLSETGAEMLGQDSEGTTYRWTFDATNPTAHAVWKALHDHKQTLAGSVKNSRAWAPKVIAGNGPKATQDSFMYRTEHGVTSLLLDDDNCDCITSLSLGHGMCGSSFSTSYGPENRFGVDLLSDPGCQIPSPDNGLTLYFRDEDDCLCADCASGLKCVDGIGTYMCN